MLTCPVLHRIYHTFGLDLEAEIGVLKEDNLPCTLLGRGALMLDPARTPGRWGEGVREHTRGARVVMTGPGIPHI